jgi:hypothetical protein
MYRVVAVPVFKTWFTAAAAAITIWSTVSRRNSLIVT